MPLTDIQKAALKLYRRPFRFDAKAGFVWDAKTEMVADQNRLHNEFSLVIARIRGWGRIKYLDNPEQLQDAVGELMALALDEFWERHKDDLKE